MIHHFTDFQLPELSINHNLAGILKTFQLLRTRRQLRKSSIYRHHQEELHALNGALSWSNRHTYFSRNDSIRVVLWNIERGINLDGIIAQLQNAQAFHEADVLLLTETDVGMGRSGNRNIPRELAQALDMNFCFANMFVSASKGDEGEQFHQNDNTLALHGLTVLSKFPFVYAESRPLPYFRDEFASLEKSLGQRHALLCVVDTGMTNVAFTLAHLDVKASPGQRSKQLDAALDLLNSSNVKRQIFGGDLNTHTYDLRNRFRLIGSLLYKLAFLGVREAISHYMMPEQVFERPVFETFNKHGFTVSGFTPKDEGTLFFDLHEITLNLKTQRWLPFVPMKWMQQMLAPWECRVPLRLDWLAGKGVKIKPACDCNGVHSNSAIVAELPYSERLSDHSPIISDILLDARRSGDAACKPHGS